MCDTNEMTEKLARVSKERDELNAKKMSAEACAAALSASLNRVRNERDQLQAALEAFQAEVASLKAELDRLTNPGPEEAPTRSDILDLAKRCVVGDREQDYGSPEQNFERIAEMWEAYLVGKCTSADVCIQPEDVAAMLALLKIARIASGHAKADNWVDLAGYAACGGEIEGARR